MENNEKEVPISRYFKVMFNRKITLLCITLGTMVLGTLGIKFIYNGSKDKYTAEYKYNVGSFNGNGSYMDGSKFYFNDMVSYEVLNEIKESNKDFSNIDIDKMIEKDAASIQFATEYNKLNEVQDQYYVLTINSSYFKSQKQAKAFISEIIDYPIKKNIKLQETINYTLNLDKFDTVEFYGNQISYLSSQYDLIVGKYDGLIGEYGNVVLSDGLSLDQHKNELVMYFTNNRLGVLSYELSQKGYVKDYDRQIDTLKIEKKQLTDEIARNEAMITELQDIVKTLIQTSTTAQSFDLGSYNAKIVELVAANSSLQKSVDDIQRQIDNGQTAPTAFVATLNKYKEELSSQTTKYRAIEKEVATENTKAFTINSNVIKASGGISTILAIPLTAVVGLVLACIVNLIVDNKYLYEDFPPVEKKSKKKKEEVEVK